MHVSRDYENHSRHCRPLWGLCNKFLPLWWEKCGDLASVQLRGDWERSIASRSLARWQDGQEESVYCICRRGEKGFMIQCSDCNEWFHGECARVTEQDADQIEDYLYDTCLEAAVEP